MTEQQYRVIADRVKGDEPQEEELAGMRPGAVVYGGSTQPRTLFRTGSDGNGRHWIGEHGERYTDAEAAEELGEFESSPHPPTREQIAEALYDTEGHPRVEWASLPQATQGVYLGYADAVLALIQNGADRD